MKEFPKILRILLLIIFSPVGLIVFALFGLIVLLMHTIGRIPLIGVYIFVILMTLLVPLYPIVMIYGLNIVAFGKEIIHIECDGFIIVNELSFIKIKKGLKVEWDEIDLVKKVFVPPGYSHEILLKSGELIKFNVFTELEDLIKTMREKDIQFNYKINEEK